MTKNILARMVFSRRKKKISSIWCRKCKRKIIR